MLNPFSEAILLRKILPFLPLILLFGCSFSRTAETDEAGIRTKYKDLAEMNVRAEISAEFPGYVTTYLLDASLQKDGVSRITVQKPESIAGVTVTLDGEHQILSVGETSLETGDLGGISPLSALPKLFRLWGSFPSEIETVNENGNPCLLVVYEEEEGICRTLFSRETYLPIRAEIFRAEECVLRIRFVT